MSIIAKLLYSVLLLGLSGVLLRELWTVWFDTTIYIGRFDVVSATGKDDSASSSFPKRIVSAQAILAQQFNDYQMRRAADAPSDATYILPGMAPLLLPPEVLAGVDITVQNVNLSQVFTALRKGFLAPNELVGNVAVREGSVLAAVDWPRAPQLDRGQPRLTRFLVPGQASEQAAAAYIASSLSWARAASLDRNVAAYERSQFCDFGVALSELYAFGEKASSPSGLDAKESALIRTRAAQLRAHYDAETVFPELYRLRADLLDLLPEGERRQGDLVEAQEDRLRYAMLSPKLCNLPDQEKRLAALALARPAILMEDGGLAGPPENWANLLRRHDTEIRSAATSIGLIVKGDGTPVGTGFIVAPQLMMTADYVLKAAGYVLERDQGAPLAAVPSRPTDRARLCLGQSKSSCDPSLEIGDIVFLQAEGSRVALANLINHDIVLNPPLLLAEPLAPTNTLVGQYAFVIGYPFHDSRMPTQFIERLLGKQDGHKRLMPGRILAFGQQRPDGFVGPQIGHPGEAVFTSDISTSGGTSGGPLLDLATGRVIGMSYGGKWQGEHGKFAYAESIPKGALDIIGRRSRGEPDQPSRSSIEPMSLGD